MPKAIYTEIEIPAIFQKANALARELNFPYQIQKRLVEMTGASLFQIAELSD